MPRSQFFLVHALLGRAGLTLLVCWLCRPVQSLERAEQALLDQSLSNGDRLGLQRRILRLGAICMHACCSLAR